MYVDRRLRGRGYCNAYGLIPPHMAVKQLLRRSDVSTGERRMWWIRFETSRARAPRGSPFSCKMRVHGAEVIGKAHVRAFVVQRDSMLRHFRLVVSLRRPKARCVSKGERCYDLSSFVGHIRG